MEFSNFYSNSNQILFYEQKLDIIKELKEKKNTKI